MEGLLGKKVGMTSIYGDNGIQIPCTVLQMGPCVVTQVKTESTDGYKAIQVAWGDKKAKHSNRAQTGHFKNANTSPKVMVHEFRNPENEVSLGQSFDVNIFTVGDFVDAIGTAKGKGFQGVVKRHGFSGVGMATHGQHNRLRAPGSVGASSYPSKVMKGMRMGGRDGGTRVKIKNLQIVKILPEHNIVLVKGAIPGHKGAIVILEKKPK